MSFVHAHVAVEAGRYPFNVFEKEALVVLGLSQPFMDKCDTFIQKKEHCCAQFL